MIESIRNNIEAIDAVILFANWDDYSADGCTCFSSAPCISCIGKISPEDFALARQQFHLMEPDRPTGPRADAYLAIGDSLGVNDPLPPAPSTRRVFQAPSNMLAGPERCGLITGFRS